MVPSSSQKNNDFSILEGGRCHFWEAPWDPTSPFFLNLSSHRSFPDGCWAVLTHLSQHFSPAGDAGLILAVLGLSLGPSASWNQDRSWVCHKHDWNDYMQCLEAHQEQHGCSNAEAGTPMPSLSGPPWSSMVVLPQGPGSLCLLPLLPWELKIIQNRLN
jgi:hypothetical protein